MPHRLLEGDTPQARDAHTLARAIVIETLETLGIDISTTEKLQETQADLRYLRRLRKGYEDFWRIFFKATLTTVIGTGMYLLWQGFLSKLK